MAEFVEQSLEELVPVFEQLGATQLLSEKQVRFLIFKLHIYQQFAGQRPREEMSEIRL